MLYLYCQAQLQLPLQFQLELSIALISFLGAHAPLEIAPVSESVSQSVSHKKV